MPELESPQSLFEQEQAVQQVILSKLKRSSVVQAEQQEAIAYRLAEIFVATRQMYTTVLPRFLELPDPPPPDTEAAKPTAGADTETPEEIEIFEVFAEVRMNILNLRDLFEDFEEIFLESLSGRMGVQNTEDQPVEEEDDDVI